MLIKVASYSTYLAAYLTRGDYTILFRRIHNNEALCHDATMNGSYPLARVIQS